MVVEIWIIRFRFMENVICNLHNLEASLSFPSPLINLSRSSWSNIINVCFNDENSRILSKERFVFWLGMVEKLVFGMMFSLETLVWQYNFLALQSLCGSKVICGKYGYGISDGRGLLEVERWGVLRIFSASGVLCGSTLWSCW